MTTGALTPVATPSAAVPGFLVYGDSIAANAFADLSDWQSRFAPATAPDVRNAGIPGATIAMAVLRLDDTLAASPDAQRVGVAFGTNDAYSGIVEPRVFAARLREVVTRLQAAGRTPILATIPWGRHAQLAGVPAFNDQIRALQSELSLTPGPDLYAWFATHQGEISTDGVHPTEAGSRSIRQQWAEVLKEAPPDRVSPQSGGLFPGAQGESKTPPLKGATKRPSGSEPSGVVSARSSCASEIVIGARPSGSAR